MGTDSKDEIRFPLERSIYTLVGVILTALIMWFGTSAAQSREDIAVIREQVSRIYRDIDTLTRGFEHLRNERSVR